MSDTEAPVVSSQPGPEAQHTALGRTSKPAYKSWRKKYYKERHKFNGLLSQNHKLFEEEQRTIQLARRLQEQNDQLLQLLYETNQSKKLPSKFRYDVHTLPEKSLPGLSGSFDDLDEKEALEFSADQFRSLASLESIPHSSLGDLPSDPKSAEEHEKTIFDDHIGYLSPNHEAEYLTALDTFDSRTQDGTAPNGPWSNYDSSAAALKNPVSVYNWLKKHQPGVFLTDEPAPRDSAGGNNNTQLSSSRAAPTKVQPKRASVSARHQAENNMDDEEYAAGGGLSESVNTGSLRGKRKHIDDEAYRPKGGSSKKRKKLSIGQSGDNDGT